MEEGLVRTPLSDLLKEFHPGDFVEIMGGPSRGQSGWVEGGWNNVVCVLVVNSSGDATNVCDVKAGPFFFNGRHLNY